MSDHQAAYPTTTMCELLGVSSRGYYAWIRRRPSQRAETDAMLIAEIRVAHEASRGTYGAPRIHAELAAKGIRVGRKRIARLMLQAGLAGVSRRRFVTTTVRDGGRPAPDVVERNFTAEAPDRLWVADITYIPTWAGFLYLAVVLDAYSRRIVGWSMATTLAKQLPDLPTHVGRCRSALGRQVAVQCPKELAYILQRAGAVWEPGSRRWLVQHRRIGRTIRWVASCWHRTAPEVGCAPGSGEPAAGLLLVIGLALWTVGTEIAHEDAVALDHRRGQCGLVLDQVNRDR